MLILGQHFVILNKKRNVEVAILIDFDAVYLLLIPKQLQSQIGSKSLNNFGFF